MSVCKKGVSILILFLLLSEWLFSPFNVFAQEEDKYGTTEDLVEAAKKTLDKLVKPVGLTMRDPFSMPQPTETGLEGGGSYEFFPTEGTTLSANLKLHGYIEDETEEPMALLGVENHGVFLVRKGDTVGLQNRGKHTVIKVIDITNLSVFVEVGTVGQVVIIR